jgi:ATP-dependent Zn protease
LFIFRTNDENVSFAVSKKYFDEFENAAATMQVREDECQQHEIVSGLSELDIDEFLSATPKNAQSMTDEDVERFVKGPRKKENSSAELFSDDDDEDAIVEATQEVCLSPPKFTTFMNKKTRTNSPPRKVVILEQRNSSIDLNNMFSTAKKSPCSSEIALKKIQEEKSKRKEIAKEISQNNENSGGFRSANQELFLRNLLKSDNVDSTQNRAKYMGNKRFVPVNSAFKIPFAKQSETENKPAETNENNECEQHPLLKNVQPEILEMIKNEVTVCTQNVQFDDIAGLEEAKKAIYEAVVVPLLRPELFKGLRTIPKGILLFGPAGTGEMKFN